LPPKAFVFLVFFTLLFAARTDDEGRDMLFIGELPELLLEVLRGGAGGLSSEKEYIFCKVLCKSFKNLISNA
jgi:hypothetical protein